MQVVVLPSSLTPICRTKCMHAFHKGLKEVVAHIHALLKALQKVVAHTHALHEAL